MYWYLQKDKKQKNLDKNSFFCPKVRDPQH
jgi:hypothetical protein